MQIIGFIMLFLGFGSALYAFWQRQQKAKKPDTTFIAPDVASYKTTGTLPPDALYHDNWRIRLEAVKQLEVTRANVPKLIDALHDADKDVRETAADALATLGDAVLLDLSALLDDPNTDTRVATVNALARIKTAEATDALIMALDDESSWVREPAIVALGARKAGIAVPEIINRLRDTDARVREAALVALKDIGTPEAKSALRDLN